jgi:quercetin dioxygenase-like cupin family protein
LSKEITVNIHSVDWSRLDWQEIRGGVYRKAFSGEGATLALHKLDPGHVPNPHSHPYEQIVYIVEGWVDFHVGSEVRRLGPGGLLVVPRDVEHWAEVIGDEPVLNLDVFTPARKEIVTT